MVGKVVSKVGLEVLDWGMLYKAVVQLVLLYGSDSWVVMGNILKVIEGFHHRLERSITGMMAWCTTIRGWDLPPVAEALYTAGIWPIKEYIYQRK